MNMLSDRFIKAERGLNSISVENIDLESKYAHGAFLRGLYVVRFSRDVITEV